MSSPNRLNPGELFRWYPSGNPELPLIQAREVQWLLDLHARPFAHRPDIPPCQCLTCIQGRRWWRDRWGADYPERIPEDSLAPGQTTLVG